jgi:protein-disulfide isomerase
LFRDVSQRNRDGKRTARERLREQREIDKAREKRKRTLIAVGAVVAVLAIAAGVGLLVAGRNNGGGVAVAAPAGAAGKDKLVIPVGASDAPSTLTVYEDFRCPACGQFEKTFTDTIHQLEDSGQIKVDYHLVRIIDGNAGGTGSLNAANAAACAQDQNKFRAYHDVLYANQPVETDDKFAQKTYLLQLADKVGGLKTPTFTTCVNNGTYDAWVKKSNSAFGQSGFNSTPTVLLNNTNIYADTQNPLTPAKLKQLVADANKGKKPGTATPSVTPSQSPSQSRSRSQSPSPSQSSTG